MDRPAGTLLRTVSTSSHNQHPLKLTGLAVAEALATELAAGATGAAEAEAVASVVAVVVVGAGAAGTACLSAAPPAIGAACMGKGGASGGEGSSTGCCLSLWCCHRCQSVPPRSASTTPHP